MLLITPIQHSQPITSFEDLENLIQDQRELEDILKNFSEDRIKSLDQEMKNYSLHVAFEIENYELVQKLIRCGADSSEINISALLIASMNQGKEEIVLWLLENCEYDVNAIINEQGDTPLHLAASINSIPILDKLIQRGANINQRNSLNDTALTQLIKEYKSLQEAYAQQMAQEGGGNSREIIEKERFIAPVLLYLYTKDKHAFDYFPQEQKNLFLFFAINFYEKVPVNESLFDLVKDMLDKGADPQAQNQGITPLGLLLIKYKIAQNRFFENIRASTNEDERVRERGNLQTIIDTTAPAALFLYTRNNMTFDGFLLEIKNHLLLWVVTYWKFIPIEENLFVLLREMINKGASLELRNVYNISLLELAVGQNIYLRENCREIEQKIKKEIDELKFQREQAAALHNISPERLQLISQQEDKVKKMGENLAILATRHEQFSSIIEWLIHHTNINTDLLFMEIMKGNEIFQEIFYILFEKLEGDNKKFFTDTMQANIHKFSKENNQNLTTKQTSIIQLLTSILEKHWTSESDS